VAPNYEFAVYSGGQSPPWNTEDTKKKENPKSDHGGWLADHTPPAAALFLPGSSGREQDAAPRLLLSSPVAEAGLVSESGTSGCTGELMTECPSD